MRRREYTEREHCAKLIKMLGAKYNRKKASNKQKKKKTKIKTKTIKLKNKPYF